MKNKKEILFTTFIYLGIAIFTFISFRIHLPKHISMLGMMILFLFMNLYVWHVFKNRILIYKPQLKRSLFFILFIPDFLLLLYDLGLNTVDILDWNRFIRTYLFGSIVILNIAKFIIGVFFVANDMFALFRRQIALKFNLMTVSHSRLIDYMGYISAVGILIFCLHGTIIGAYRLHTKTEDITLTALPKSFDGYKVAQISDIHIGSFVSGKPIRRLVETIKEIKPDMIVITGDIINLGSKEMLPYMAILQQLAELSPDGVYVIRGNHDYGKYLRWPTPADSLQEVRTEEKYFRQLNWTLLNNEHRIIRRHSDSLVIAGTEYWGKSPKSMKFADGQKALAGVSSESCVLMLAHDPNYFAYVIIKEYPWIGLTLSGHTHAAQLSVKIGENFSPSMISSRYWKGLYEVEGQYLYVNPGFGFNGLPFRIGNRPELTLFTLHSK